MYRPTLIANIVGGLEVKYGRLTGHSVLMEWWNGMMEENVYLKI